MDLRDYLRILRRNWPVIVALALAGLLVGGAASLLSKPTYTAETQLFVAIQGSGTVQELQQGNTFTQARVQSYVKTVESPVVLQPVIDTLGLDLSAEVLAGKVAARTDANTVLISIAIEDESPVRASAIAAAVANSLINAVDMLEKPKAGGTSPVSLSVIKPAIAPLYPSAPNTRLNLLVGFLTGTILGLGVALLRTTLDARIRNEDDLRQVTESPLLGAITFDPRASDAPLVTQSAPKSPRAEAFRQLRTNLQFANVTGTANTVLITSSLPGEGKSTTAANLAIALAQSGRTVCLVDADLRRPMVDDYLGLERNAGLTTAIVGAADVNELLQPWGENELYVLTSGQIPPNPSELLGSTEMQHLIGRLGDAFDTVIIDAPPLLPVTDAAVLSQHVGGVVLVVGVQKIKRHDLEKSLAGLRLVGANLLGVVLNRVPAKGADAYDYGYYTHETTSSPEPAASPKKFRRAQAEAASDVSWRAALEEPAGRFRNDVPDEEVRA